MCVYMSVYVWGVHVCYVAHVAIRGQPQTLVLVFYLLVGCCGSHDIWPEASAIVVVLPLISPWEFWDYRCTRVHPAFVGF